MKENISNEKQNEQSCKTDVISWVAVTEKLPETNCYVLVVKKNGKVVPMSFHAPFDSGKRIFQWWGFGAWLDQHRQVTHWMRIPEPPCL